MRDLVRKIMANVGEKLVVEIAESNRERGYQPFPQGSEVEVLGYETTFTGRVGGMCPPGIYTNPQWIQVKGETGSVEVVWAGFLGHLPGQDGHRIRQSEMWQGDLPETRFWEWDIVRTPDGEECRVIHISYDQIGKFRNDGITPMPIYDCGTTTNYSCYQDEHLEMVERGPIWRRANGEEITFNNIDDETEFHIAVGEYEDLRDPQFKGYTWQLDDALAALEAGEGHGLRRPPLLGGAITVVRFDDEEFGERVRLATLDGFSRGRANRM